MECDTKFIRDFIKDKTGITYKENKDYFLKTKLAPLMSELGCKSMLDLYNFIKMLPLSNEVLRNFIDAITINETSFFRDILPFKILKEHIFPKFLVDKGVYHDTNLSIPY